MKLWEALKIYDETGRKIRPSGHLLPFQEPNVYLYGLVPFKAEEWEVEPEKQIVMTRESFAKLWDKMLAKNYIGSWMNKADDSDVFKELCQELGL